MSNPSAARRTAPEQRATAGQRRAAFLAAWAYRGEPGPAMAEMTRKVIEALDAA